MREIYREIGDRIRRFRKRAGMTQADVANAIAVSNSTYAKLESGDRRLNVADCIALAKLFGTSCDMILLGNEISIDAGFAAEKLERLLQITGMAKALADEIYDDAFTMKIGTMDQSQ